MKSIYYKTLLLMAVISGTATAQAQNTGKVTGTVVTDQGKPADYATVSLLRAKDSSIVKSTLSNEQGGYILDKLSTGTYLVKASVIGYEKAVSQPITLTGSSAAIHLPVIKLTTTAHNLKAVNIVATKPLIEHKADRTVVNVENSALAAGNTAMDILERSPGITIDKDDNISLRGKQGVTVMIDGKLTYLSSAQLANLLRSTDGNTIQSIEIITNPSAKYDAAGNSGIINIKLKKNKVSGTNGSFIVGAGYGNNHKANTSLNLNRKEGKLNLFSSYSYMNNKRPQDLNINRLITNNTVNTYFNEATDILGNRSSHNYRLGADYELNKNNVLGVQFSGFNSSSDVNTFNNTRIGPDLITTNNITTTRNTNSEAYNNYAVNLNNRITLDTAGKELAMDADYSYFNTQKNNNYINNYYKGNGITLDSAALLRNSLPTKINIATFKADYTNPLGKTMKLEAGLKFSYVNTNNNLVSDSLRNNIWVVSPKNTNLFKYTENINAGYINFSKNWKKTSIQAGLRAEQTNSTGDSRDINDNATVTKRHYLNLFPSVFINHNFSDKHTLGINYSRRIDRPSYDDLNSFTFILNPYTFAQGNPYLKPEYTNSYQLSYTYNKSYNVSIGYSKTTDVMAEVPRQDDVHKITFITRDNLAVQNNYNINLSVPLNLTKWWNSNNNVSGFYLGFKSDSLKLDDGQYAANINSINTFTLSKTVKLEATYNYQSALTYSLFHIRSNYSIDGGISKSFANKKANLKLSVSDIFNTRKQYITVQQGNLNFNIMQKNETRVARLTLTYNFGNTKLQMRRHDSGSQDEQSRVKTGN